MSLLEGRRLEETWNLVPWCLAHFRWVEVQKFDRRPHLADLGIQTRHRMPCPIAAPNTLSGSVTSQSIMHVLWKARIAAHVLEEVPEGMEHLAGIGDTDRLPAEIVAKPL